MEVLVVEDQLAQKEPLELLAALDTMELLACLVMLVLKVHRALRVYKAPPVHRVPLVIRAESDLMVLQGHKVQLVFKVTQVTKDQKDHQGLMDYLEPRE